MFRSCIPEPTVHTTISWGWLLACMLAWAEICSICFTVQDPTHAVQGARAAATQVHCFYSLLLCTAGNSNLHIHVAPTLVSVPPLPVGPRQPPAASIWAPHIQIGATRALWHLIYSAPDT